MTLVRRIYTDLQYVTHHPPRISRLWPFSFDSTLPASIAEPTSMTSSAGSFALILLVLDHVSVNQNTT